MPSFNYLLRRIENQLGHALRDRIFFLHLPKCGGASLSHAIHWSYRTLDIRQDRNMISLDPAASADVARLIYQTNYPDDTNDDYPILKVREHLLLYFMGQNHVRYLSGHFIFSDPAHRAYGSKFAFITLLRDPVKRWISAYFYNRYKTAEHRKIEADIMPYLESHFGQSQGYEYVKFLGGADESGNYTCQQAVDRAKQNLHKFEIVGFLEQRDDFINKFEARFGVRLKLEKRNESPASEAVRQTVITPAIEEKIKMICQPDLEVYQYALDQFAKP